MVFATSFTRNKKMLSQFSSIKSNTKTLRIPFAGVKVGVQVEITYLKESL